MNKVAAQKVVIDSKIPASIKAGVEALAKGLGVAAIELWSIFVRQYIVKGLTQLFTGLVIVGIGILLTSVIGYWSLIVFGLSLPCFYGTIMLLGNPKYWAISDITKKIKEIK